MGLDNVKTMIPFCRTVEEGKKVIRTMAGYGLQQHKNGLEIYVMAEIPSNVLLADEFAEIFDGFSEKFMMNYGSRPPWASSDNCSIINTMMLVMLLQSGHESPF
jgi:hypothetical protein